jgi:PAS domain S-box-containing protein
VRAKSGRRRRPPGSRLRELVEALREKEARLEAIIASEPECVKVLDAAGRVLEMNPAGLAMIGAGSFDAVAGQCVYPLIAPEHREAFRALTERVCRGGAGGTLRFEIVGLTGERRWLETHVTPIRDVTSGKTRMLGVTRDISEQKRVEQLLAESEARFRDFARASGDWFWETDAENRFTWMSDSVEAVTGLPPQWFRGRRRDELVARREDLDSEHWRAHVATIARHEPYRDFRYLARGPQGELWLSSSGVPVFGADGTFCGYRGVGSDVTQRVMLERQAAKADERLREAIEHLGEPICLTDAEDRIVVANRRFREINAAVGELVRPGRRYEEHLRAGLRLGLFPDAAGREDEWLAERLARRRAGSPMREVKRQDGLWLMVSDRKLADGSTLSFGLDITAQRRVEAALRDLARDLERRVAERTAELEAAIRELEAFSYSVSHDLRAPLRAIGSFARMVVEDEGGGLSAEGRRKLGVVEANARRMGELVDDLLQLARVNRSELKSEVLDMRSLAASIAGELSPLYPRSRIEIGALPPARGDPVLVRQALANLLDNALKYSSRASEPRVELGWDGAARAWAVRDNGVGFAMEHAKKLFRAFERLHDEREFPGTGIGLAIVRRVIERHGGRVWAESAPGTGAAFYFTLG